MRCAAYGLGLSLLGAACDPTPPQGSGATDETGMLDAELDDAGADADATASDDAGNLDVSVASSDASSADTGDAVDASLDGESPAPVDAAPTHDASSGPDAALDTSADTGTDAQSQACDRAPDVSGLALRIIVSGISKLVYAAQPPGSNDWYLVQQTGQILRREQGATSNSLFLDLSSEIALLSDSDERGLLGLAFPSDYESSGLFYVMLSPTVAGEPETPDVVRQYRRTPQGPQLQALLVTVPPSPANHNGGTLAFGPDGMLYIATGDGGLSCNAGKPGAPQDPASLFGKLLRLDPTNVQGGYASPGFPFTENPLVWHIGLRNPFRFGIDRVTGDLYIGDVGQDAYEEVNYAHAADKGLNFGWPAREGNEETCTGSSLNPAVPYAAPIFVADRRAGAQCSDNDKKFCDWNSVIGGVVYRGQAIPKLQGAYLFGDFYGRRMVALYQCGATTSPQVTLLKTLDPSTPEASYLAEPGLAFSLLTGIVESSAGEIHLIVNRDSLRQVVPR